MNNNGVQYGKAAQKVLELLAEVPKEQVTHILTFVAQLHGLSHMNFYENPAVVDSDFKEKM